MTEASQSGTSLGTKLAEHLHRIVGAAPLVVHTSLRSFGAPRVAPSDLWEVLLADNRTVIVPTFSEGFELQPAIEDRLAQNGMVYGPPSNITKSTPWFGDWTVDVNADMGAMPKSLFLRTDYVRGWHPLNSFASRGAEPALFVGPGDAYEVYAPLNRVIDSDGYILLAGVGYWSLTLLHLAEHNAGRRLFRKWALDRHRRLSVFEVGSCSLAFGNFRSELDNLAVRFQVGESKCRLIPARLALQVATKLIRHVPSITHCGRDSCLRCRDQALGGPIYPAGASID